MQGLKNWPVIGPVHDVPVQGPAANPCEPAYKGRRFGPVSLKLSAIALAVGAFGGIAATLIGWFGPYRGLGTAAFAIALMFIFCALVAWCASDVKKQEQASLENFERLKRVEGASARLAAIVESSTDAIISKSLDGVILSWNKSAERLFGYSAEEIIGQPVTKLFAPGREHEEPEILERIRSGQIVDHFETVRRRKDGSIFDVSLTISPIRDASGQIIGASKILRDITERKRIEQELQKARETLEERVQERTASLKETTDQLESFCYTIAHDLRSPLRAQQSYAQLLLDDYHEAIGETGRTYADRIIKAAGRLDELVVDLLTYSRLSREELSFANVDLNAVLAEVQHTLNHDIHAAGAEIEVGELFPVYAYEPTLKLVLTNLLSNAFKFVVPGRSPRVKIWSERCGSRVRVWIEDNGIGIAPQHLEKIFGVFQRLHVTDKYPGTGIGLAIVQKGLQRMDGHVGVESEADAGSKFWFDLPAAK